MAQKSVPFDKFLTDFLKKPGRACAYLDEVFKDTEEEDYELFICQAIREVIRAQGFARVSEKAGVGRESLYKSFADHSDPRMSTLLRVLRSMGFGISIIPLPLAESSKPLSRPKTSGAKGKPKAASRAGARVKKQAAVG